MPSKNKQPEIPLPKSWGTHVKSAILHVIALGQYALTYSRSWAADSSNQRVRLKAECDRLEQEVALCREEIRIKDVRMAQIDPQRRPHYPATERMAILELRATRGRFLEQAAKVFLLTADTISSWMRRIDETGSEALVQTCQPVNKFPDCAGYLVQRLKTLCPSLGKQKIAQVLCRAGLHLGTTTVGRILKEDPHPNPAEKQAASPQVAEEVPQVEKAPAEVAQRVVTAKRIHHVWHVDLTLVPTQLGFWASWLPFSLAQCWPFGYWVAVVIDHFSRRAMGFAVFKKEPHSQHVRAFLGRVMHQAQAKPKYLICDQGKQFLVRGLQGLVSSSQRDPPEVWGRGPTWQHCGGGTLHPNGKGRMYSKTPCVATRQDVPAGTVLVYRLVQPTSAAFDVGTSCSLASACPLCLASGAGQGTARSADRDGGELPAQPQAFAHRRHPARRERDLGRVPY